MCVGVGVCVRTCVSRGSRNNRNGWVASVLESATYIAMGERYGVNLVCHRVEG